MKDITTWVVFALMLGITSMKAQQKCASDLLHVKELKNEWFAAHVDSNEAVIQKRIQNNKQKKVNGSIYTIPVVVHVVHLGEAIGVGNNISEAQVLSGITQLNNSFKNVHGKSLDTEIQFALAKIDPNCNSTDGIIRVDGSGISGYSSDGVQISSTGGDEVTLKALSKWSNKDYYNIWIISEFDGNNGGNGTQGFAYFSSAGADKDGCMIMNTAWGDQGTVNFWNNKGNTIVHELGHALDLYHTFAGDRDETGAEICPVGNQCGTTVINNITVQIGDCCADTSPHKRSSSNCLTSATNACTGLLNDDVIHNFMDYSDQDCSYLFTSDQKARMRAVLETTRAPLLTSKALDGTFSFVEPIAATCTPVTAALGLSNYFAGILKVNFSDMTHVSDYANVDLGYYDRTNSCVGSINVEPEGTYDLSVSVGGNTNRVKAWIDYNNDGSFSESTELVYSQTIAPNQTGVQSISIPANALKDVYLRMRVMNDIATVSDACYNPTHGQAEDYAIIIKTPTNAKIVNAVQSFQTAPNPFTSTVTVTGYTGQSATYVIRDLTGKTVTQGKLNSTASTIVNTSGITAGVYVITVNSDGQQVSQKIIKID